jgi:hypothetical protein
VGFLQVFHVQVFIESAGDGNACVSQKRGGQGDIPRLPEKERGAQVPDGVNFHAGIAAIRHAPDLASEVLRRQLPSVFGGEHPRGFPLASVHDGRAKGHAGRAFQ